MNGSADTRGGLVFKPGPPVCVQVKGSAARFPVHRVYCVGQNYREHAREMGASTREAPFFFSKPADAVISVPRVPWPPMTGNLHHEVELVAALSAGGRNLSPEEGLEAVFGYAVGVDLTRRDLQAEAKKHGRPWTTAKGFDCSAPLSAIQPVTQAGHPADSAISLSVNGDQRQAGNLADMTWSVPEIIAELSRYFELMPGDLIFTGTPPGVAPLRPGDRIRAVIDGVGELAFEMGACGGT